MKLLFDQNLSGALVRKLSDLFPGSAHVKDLDLSKVHDQTVWDFARQHEFTIVSKDSDFQQLSLYFGAPPKVIWLRVGNCPTSRIERLIRDRSVEVHTFAADPRQSLLVLA